MDVKAYLISQGSDAETAEAISSNPKFAAIYEKAATEAENGQTAYQKALEVEATMKKWNQNEVIPYVQRADASVAAANSKVAAQAAYLKTLKDQGYDIPDEYLAGAAPSAAVAPAKVDPAPVKNDEMLNYAKANMALIAMSNKYRKLTGDELDPEAEYNDFSSNARPNENLRVYIDRKYDLGAKEAAVATEKKAAYEKGIADKAVAAAQAEWAKSHGTNGETRIPQNSKFAEIAASRKESGGDKLWQTKEGRAQADQRRLEKYSQIM